MRAPRLHVDGSARRQGPAIGNSPWHYPNGTSRGLSKGNARGVIRHTIANRDICCQAHRLACSRRDRLHLPGVLPHAHREPGILARAPRAELDDLRAPRGALLYSPRSGHGLEEVSLDLMADP
jgi:hypothetical protein